MEKCVNDEGNLRAPITRLHFRPLRADEVDVRPAAGTNDGNKVKLLLYQDARCAMNILDDTVGPQGWQKKYYEAAGMLFCDIGILDPDTKQWLWKSDTGSKSTIEEDKGQASDAFKRASVAWGIGRELYTAPRITIDVTDKDMFNNKFCQSFKVETMVVSDGIITDLVIVDKWGNKRFEYNAGASPVTVIPSAANNHKTTSPPTEQVMQHPNEVRLNQYYTQLKSEPDIDSRQLERFLSFYMGESDREPGKSRAATWHGYFNPKERWTKWLANAYGSNM